MSCVLASNQASKRSESRPRTNEATAAGILLDEAVALRQRDLVAGEKVGVRLLRVERLDFVVAQKLGRRLQALADLLALLWMIKEGERGASMQGLGVSIGRRTATRSI